MKNNKNIIITFFTLIHFFSIFLALFHILFSFIIFYEFFFFIIINNLNFKKILRIVIFSLLIFILNTLFLDGRILFKIFNFYITYEGVTNGIKKCSIFLNLFFFTSNIFNFKNYILKIIPKDTLFVDSIFYFNKFLNLLNNKITFKSLLRNIIKIYKDNSYYYEDTLLKNDIKILFYYNIFIIPLIFIIFILKEKLIVLLNLLYHFH